MTPEQPTSRRRANARRLMSLRTRLLLTINGLFFVGLIGLLWIDYRLSLNNLLQSQHTALSDSAALMLPAVTVLRDHGHPAVQTYIDQACARIQESLTPGHHIVVRLGDTVLQARTHHRASPAFPEAMALAEARPDHRATVDGQVILVGSQGDDAVRIYVSQFTTNIRRAARRQAMTRAGGILLVGLAGAGLVNLLLCRLVTRPIDRLVRTVRRIGEGELGVRSERFAAAELDYLAGELDHMSQSLAETDRHRARQLAKARRIQQNLLPQPDTLQRLGIHHVHMPAEAVGGDFFDVRTPDEHRLVLCLGDVTGHGVPAAMSASMLKTLFQHSAADPADPADVLAEINRRFHAVTLDGDFATLFLATLDRRDGRLVYASAGHEFGYVIRRNGLLETLGATGLLLGIDPDARCACAHLELEPGDRLVLLTDGLIEAMSPTGTILGRSAIRHTLRRTGRHAVDQIAAALLQQAATYRAGLPQQDDITLAIFQA